MVPTISVDKSLNVFISVFLSCSGCITLHLYLSNPILASTTVEDMQLLLIKMHTTKHVFFSDNP